MRDALGLVGIVTVTVRDSAGRLVWRAEYRNTVTNYARQAIAAWLAGTANAGQTTAPPPSMTALGTGTGTPAPTDTALWAEAAGTRKTCAFVQTYQTYYAEWSTQYLTTDPAGTFTEAGLLDANGNLWAHVSMSVSKTSSQTLTLDWKFYIQGN
ncbi:MAG: hypothetical protein QJR03_15020 [Sphaerobacter sp.]|nr:hypothetical protein [Sphaerobacter sp.]